MRNIINNMIFNKYMKKWVFDIVYYARFKVSAQVEIEVREDYKDSGSRLQLI